MNRAVFLDRDNTLIRDEGYIHRPEEVVLLPKVGEGLSLLKSRGYLLIVLSNQSGIGRGFFTEKDFHAVNEKLQQLLAPYRVKIDDFLFCPHRPEERCGCRKPKTGMVERAKAKWNIDVSESLVIGDKDSDVLLAINSGCKGAVKVGEKPFADFLSAVQLILGAST